MGENLNKQKTNKRTKKNLQGERREGGRGSRQTTKKKIKKKKTCKGSAGKVGEDPNKKQTNAKKNIKNLQGERREGGREPKQTNKKINKQANKQKGELKGGGGGSKQTNNKQKPARGAQRRCESIQTLAIQLPSSSLIEKSTQPRLLSPKSKRGRWEEELKFLEGSCSW